MQIIFILGGLIIAGSIAGTIGYFYYRRILREAKNYERGLKIVTTSNTFTTNQR